MACLAAGGVRAAGRTLRVEAPGGAFDATARVECLDPAADPIAIDSKGEAHLPEGCARARCRSDRWLPGEVAGSLCTLAPAAVLEIELPAAARGTFAIRLESKAARAVTLDAAITLGDGAAPSRLVLPPVRPGPYLLRIRRDGETWTCSASPPTRRPERARVVVAWRDPVMQRGRVLDGEGKPLAGVPLRVEAASVPSPVEGSWSCGPDPSTSPVSAPDGGFEVPVDPPVETLFVAGAWDDPRGIAWGARRGQSVEPMTLALRNPYRVEARALDDEDVPPPCRAKLVVEERLDSWAGRVLAGSAREGTCGPDGRIRLGPTLARAFELEIRSEEALPARRRGQGGAGAAIDLGVVRMDRGVTLIVEAADGDDGPVVGAQVIAENGEGVVLRRTARTDRTGRAVLKGLPRETPFDLRVSARDFATAEASRVTPGAAPIRIVLPRGLTLRGRVLTPDGTPSPDAVVFGRAVGEAPPSRATADAEGVFALEVSPGGLEVRASSAGFADSDTMRLDVAPGSPPAEVDIRLRERGAVRGTVVDPDGRPVSGATVLVMRGRILLDPPEEGATASTVTDAAGEFSLPGPSLGESVVALARGFAPALAEHASADPERLLELRLGLAAAVRVRLPDALAESARLILRDGSPLQRAVSARSRTDLTVEDLTPSLVTAQLAAGPTRKAKLVPGETAIVDFRGAGWVKGRVTRGGAGAPRAVVACVDRASTGEPTGGTALTDDDGRFELPAVSSGPQRIVAQSASARAEGTVDVPEGGEARIELELIEARVEVLVTDARSGAGVVGALVNAARRGATCRSHTEVGTSDEDGGWRLSLSDAGCASGTSGSGGRASLAMSVPGTYALGVRAHDYEPWQGTVEIVEGVVEVRVPLAPGGGAPRVRVLLQSDPPGAAGTLYCVQRGRSNSRSPVAGEGLCDNAEPGPIEIAFRVPGLGIGRTALDVPEHGEAQAAVSVTRGGDLVVPLPGPIRSIRVLDDRGTMWNQPAGRGWPECGTTSDEQGATSYVCRALPAGPYTVEIDGQKRGGVVVVRPGETTTVY